MTEFLEFFYAPNETFRDLENTNLEISNYGRLRNVITKAWYGRVIYQVDLEAVANGTKPVWLKEVVQVTDKPVVYFEHRSPNEKEEISEYLKEAA